MDTVQIRPFSQEKEPLYSVYMNRVAQNDSEKVYPNYRTNSA